MLFLACTYSWPYKTLWQIWWLRTLLHNQQMDQSTQKKNHIRMLNNHWASGSLVTFTIKVMTSQKQRCTLCWSPCLEPCLYAYLFASASSAGESPLAKKKMRRINNYSIKWRFMKMIMPRRDKTWPSKCKCRCNLTTPRIVITVQISIKKVDSSHTDLCSHFHPVRDPAASSRPISRMVTLVESNWKIWR